MSLDAPRGNEPFSKARADEYAIIRHKYVNPIFGVVFCLPNVT